MYGGMSLPTTLASSCEMDVGKENYFLHTLSHILLVGKSILPLTSGALHVCGCVSYKYLER